MRIISSLIVVFICTITLYAYTNPIRSGFGADGPYEVSRDSIPSPAVKDAFIHLFRPEEVDTSLPVIFFCHGIGAHEPRYYKEFLVHIASRGYTVLYPPYSQGAAMARPLSAYEMLLEGFEAGVSHWRNLLDSTKIGFAGHSYGGGAVPAVAWQWVKEKNWGTAGAFMYIMAPWYSYNISPQQLSQFPDTLPMVMQVFDNDVINDHRMAKDIFDNSGILIDFKNYLIVHSDSQKTETLYADHAAPTGLAGGEKLDAVDFYGIWRIFDALCAFSFSGDSLGKLIALESSPLATDMGTWENGEPRRRMTATRSAYVMFPQNRFINFWNHARNPRYTVEKYFDSPSFFKQKARSTIRNYITMRPSRNLEKKLLAPHSSDDLHFPQPDSGYGAPGPYAVVQKDFPHPGSGHGKVYVVSPQIPDTSLPAIVFLHGFQWPMPDFYLGFITFLASHGYHVIFPSYMLYRTTFTHNKRYDLILQGAKDAFAMLGPQVDTTRIGFVGHSYGGGALPAVAWHYLKLKEWGEQGAFLFISAPWYVKKFAPYQFEYFPSQVNLIVQVYEGDVFNDWRIAEDIFYSFKTIANRRKKFYIVHNDQYKGKRLEAEHISPLSSGEDDINAIDYYALYRLTQALCQASFENDSNAYNLVLGKNSPQQRFMGRWPDGTPITEMTVTRRPVTPYSEFRFLFKWSRPWNKRRKYFEPAKK